MSSKGHILVVDDEPNAVRILSAILSAAGYRVSQAFHVTGARKKIDEEDFDAVVTDMKMPDGDGTDLYDHVNVTQPDIPVIFLTAYGTVESAVSAMSRGAYHYFIKPPDYEGLKVILARAVEQRRLKRELAELKKQLAGGRSIIGKSAPIQRVLDVIQAIKDSESSVLIGGETGTGKELVARALHYEGVRRERPFVAVNCAAIPRDLIESELFGYEKGAFTGAVSRRIGRFEQATGGTLFLDEVGELDLAMQAKLLRVLQEREIERLGGNQKIPVHFRLVAATNRDLRKEVKRGAFRDDLFYRLHVVQIDLPPLRERLEDLPLLVSEMVKEIGSRENKVVEVPPAVFRLFSRYSWPGNIRELRNVVERAVVLARGRRITEQDLPEEILVRESVLPLPPVGFPSGSLKEMEARAIRDALVKFQGNKSKAAQMLGMSRKTFYKRLVELKIPNE